MLAQFIVIGVSVVGVLGWGISFYDGEMPKLTMFVSKSVQVGTGAPQT